VGLLKRYHELTITIEVSKNGAVRSVHSFTCGGIKLENYNIDKDRK